LRVERSAVTSGDMTAPRTVPGEATRERLLDAAAELFYREGVSTGIQALAKSAGVSKRSMYELFASKDELLSAALERRTPEVKGPGPLLRQHLNLLPGHRPSPPPRSRPISRRVDNQLKLGHMVG
jgi:AcrR family transcriptional regulator